MIDLHSHLLPAIDDGVETFEEGIDILRELKKHGINELFVTPHYIAETIYDSPRSDNLKLLGELKKAIAEENIDIKLHIGNEIYIAPEISWRLRDKTLSSLGGSKYLLIELPMSGVFEGYEDIFRNLIAEGYIVILAHPERYISIQKDFAILGRLKNIGVLFQANLGSIVGQYGRHAQKTIKKMAKKDLIYAFGTDTHHMRDFSEIDEAIHLLTKIYGEAKLAVLLEDNPLKILK